jgi:hypothetical protein
MVQSTGDGQPHTGDPGTNDLARALNEPAPSETSKGTTGGGADSQPTEPAQSTPRTYSEQEWDRRQSALDKQVAEANSRAARLTVEFETERAAFAEQSARAADDRMVEDGDLSRQEADQRSRERVDSLRAASELRQREENVLRMEARGEEVGRLAAAHDFAIKYGVDANVLLEDKTLTDPEKMEAKADKLSFAREREEFEATKRTGRPQERFDGGGGGVGNAGGAVADMDPLGKIRHALDHPPKGSTRNRSN